MKKIIFILLITTIFITGCKKDIEITKENGETKKKILYKMKIDDLPYANQEVLTYRYYDIKGNDISLLIDNKNDCMYFATMKYDRITTQENYNSCSFSVKDNKINLNLNVHKMSWFDGNDYFESETDENVLINGEFHISFKQLTLYINNTEYILLNGSYRTMLDKDMEYALYDEKTNTFYDLNGLSIYKKYDTDNIDGKKIQLDLSEYEVHDGYTENKLWSTN